MNPIFMGICEKRMWKKSGNGCRRRYFITFLSFSYMAMSFNLLVNCGVWRLWGLAEIKDTVIAAVHAIAIILFSFIIHFLLFVFTILYFRQTLSDRILSFYRSQRDPRYKIFLQKRVYDQHRDHGDKYLRCVQRLVI